MADSPPARSWCFGEVLAAREVLQDHLDIAKDRERTAIKDVKDCVAASRGRGRRREPRGPTAAVVPVVAKECNDGYRIKSGVYLTEEGFLWIVETKEDIRQLAALFAIVGDATSRVAA